MSFSYFFRVIKSCLCLPIEKGQAPDLHVHCGEFGVANLIGVAVKSSAIVCNLCGAFLLDYFG